MDKKITDDGTSSNSLLSSYIDPLVVWSHVVYNNFHSSSTPSSYLSNYYGMQRRGAAIGNPHRKQIPKNMLFIYVRTAARPRFRAFFVFFLLLRVLQGAINYLSARGEDVREK